MTAQQTVISPFYKEVLQFMRTYTVKSVVFKIKSHKYVVRTSDYNKFDVIVYKNRKFLDYFYIKFDEIVG